MEQQVGRYKIVGKLGKGAMGMVFLAEDPVLHRQVALKTIDLSVDDPNQRGFLHDRLLRDARAAAALSHPHIVGVFDIVEEADCAWLVMEYIPGETLAQRMSAGTPLDTGFILRILAEVASALDYTHARGVIHRDIKPSNIMIDTHGGAKIMDFGIARLAQARTTTPTGMVMGTVEYMAPEQVKGEPLDGRADQFALAAVAYQVLTGSTLFGPQSLTTLTYKLVNEVPPLPRARNPLLPPAVDDVLSRALKKQPAERFVNCAGFVAALEAAFSGSVPMAPPTERTPAEPPSGKKWLWAGIAAAVVLAGLVFGGVLLLHRKNPAGPPATAIAQPPAVPAVTQPVTSTPSAPTPSAPTPSAPTPTAPTPIAPTPTAPAGQSDSPAVAKTAPATLPASKTRPLPVPSSLADSDPVESVPPAEPPPPIDKPGAPGRADRALDEARQDIVRRDFPAAITVLSRVIANNPQSGQAYELRGLANQELKSFENAIQDYTADLQFNPTHAYALHQRGWCHAQLKQDNLALADFNSALQLRPDFASTYIARGHIYIKRKAYKKAIADFDQAIALAPRSVNAYHGRMIARRQSGDLAGARQDQDKLNELKTH
jgi:serine/threonine protein kinase/regulator of sirC expression with transglutaminase-like and TPR domain